MNIHKYDSLKKTRDHIDTLDDQIVELIATRNAYIKQLAHFKNSIDEIKESSRISDVINRVRSKAISLDLSPNLINDLYVRMIDAMVDSEITEFHNAKNY